MRNWLSAQYGPSLVEVRDLAKKIMNKSNRFVCALSSLVPVIFAWIAWERYPRFHGLMPSCGTCTPHGWAHTVARFAFNAIRFWPSWVVALGWFLLVLAMRGKPWGQKLRSVLTCCFLIMGPLIYLMCWEIMNHSELKALRTQRLNYEENQKQLYGQIYELRQQITKHLYTYYKEGENQEAHGEFDQAEISYNTAIALATLAQNAEVQAEVLFRLLQTKRTQGKPADAINILKKLSDEFSPTTSIYTRDYPVPAAHSEWPLRKICSELNRFYATIPVEVIIRPVKPVFTTKEHPQFNVFIKNTTDHDITLACSHSSGDDDMQLVPHGAGPSVLINDRGWSHFIETAFLRGNIIDVIIKSNQGFSYIGSLPLPIRKPGKHVFGFIMNFHIKLSDGKEWENNSSFLANSVVLDIQEEPGKATILGGVP